MPRSSNCSGASPMGVTIARTYSPHRPGRRAPRRAPSNPDNPPCNRFSLTVQRNRLHWDVPLLVTPRPHWRGAVMLAVRGDAGGKGAARAPHTASNAQRRSMQVSCFVEQALFAHYCETLSCLSAPRVGYLFCKVCWLTNSRILFLDRWAPRLS